MRQVTIVLVTVLLALGPGAVQATEEQPSTSGRFVPTEAPSEFRLMHAATPLGDGRVLVTGGWHNFTDLAEAWDPMTGAFEPAGSLVELRAAHTMTLLQDGRVLVVGGPGGPESEGFTASAEIWGPATETFELVGPLADGRAQHSATLLADGRVLIVGGTDGDSALASAEVWDLVTGVFEPAGSLAGARAFHTATLLDDGRVLVTGGWDWASEPALASAEIWDPQTASFSPTGSLLQAREIHTATLLDDGRVLIAGGRSRVAGDETSTAAAELWDPDTGSFEPAGSLAEARLEHTANLLPDGRVLVVGGMDPVTEDAAVAEAELWDPDTASFGSAGAMAGATAMHTATLLPDGRVLVVGALFADEEFLPTAEIWEPLGG